MPPAASICIIKDVPERGRPETMVITVEKPPRRFRGDLLTNLRSVRNCPRSSIHVPGNFNAEKFQHSRGNIAYRRCLLHDLAIREEHAGNEARIDTMIAAPSLHIIFKN